MATYDAEFGDRPGHVLRLTLDQGTQSQSGNWTDVTWNLYLVRTASSSTTWLGSGASWSLTASGTSWSGASGYDFRSSWLIHLGSGVKRMTHDSNGYSTIVVDAAFSGGPLGSTSVRGVMALTRIPKPPAAPTPLGLSEITATSMRFQFQGNSNNGANVTKWELQYSTASNFSGATTLASTGTSTVTGLLPGTTYYFRARGYNVAGWGPYSSAISDKTLSSVYISNGSSWVPAQVYVSNGSSWSDAEVLFSTGFFWIPAG